MSRLNASTFDSPAGTLLLVSDERARLRALGFADHAERFRRELRQRFGFNDFIESETPAEIAEPLRRYFAGELRALDQVVVSVASEPFQQRVWDALRRIPPGATTSYGELARALGANDPRVAMEVGAANAANPVAIVVPCHRVIGRDGDLKGYAWGPHRKRWLLQHEGAPIPQRATTAQQAKLEEPRLPGF